MPIQHKIVGDHDYVYSSCEGALTLDDFENQQLEFWSQPDLFGLNEIFDLKQADLSQLSYSDINTIVQNFSRKQVFDPHARLAIVMNTEQQQEKVSHFSTAKMFTVTSTRSTLIFNSEEEALAWIKDKH